MIRLVVLAVVVVALAAGAAITGGDALVERLDDVSGVAGALTFAVVYALATVLLVPGSVLTIAAGALFGTVAGATVSSTGAGVGAVISYLIARRAGRSAVERLAGSRTRRIDGWVARRQFRSVLVLRLVPIIPFGPLNYSAGLSSVRLVPYTAATFLGIIPGALIYANVGATGRDPTSLAFAASVALLLALTVGSTLVARRWGRPTIVGTTEAG